jgi:CHASE2 domain-containing sensor protein
LEAQIGKPPFWIDFPAPSHLLFRSYSSAQLLEGRIPERSLAGAIVILGSSYDTSLDRVLTPVSRSVAPWSGLWGINPVAARDLPGGIVHAYAAHTVRQLIRGRAPFHVGPWIPTLIGLIIGSLQAWVGMRRYSLLAVPESVLVLPILYVFVCLWLAVSGYGFLPVVRPIAAFVLSFASLRHILCRIGRTHINYEY